MDLNGDFTPELDYLDGDTSFDFDNADLGGEMIGALPGSGGEPEQHDKRKSPDENESPEEGDAKRQETQEGEKGAKKPGRKPLTNEPTTKRKAQNRAAQRAFRERKEKHLKDLETKVTELAKAREADQHENGMLKAQVDRLQIELREYRKKLSLNGSAGRSPPLTASNASQRASTGSAHGQNSFQFDFPKFGALPEGPVVGGQTPSYTSNGHNSQRDSTTPPVTGRSNSAHGSFSGTQQPVLNRANSGGRSLSPNTVFSNGSNSGSPSNQNQANIDSATNNTAINFAPYSTNENMHGFASTLPQMNANNNSDPFGDLFSPNLLKTVNQNGNSYFDTTQQASAAPVMGNAQNGGDSTAGIPDNRVFRFNSTSNGSDSASPSASSLSQWNMNGTANSSCGTSPEPSHGSPANKEKNIDSFDKTITQNSFNNNNNNAFMSNQFSNNDLSAFAVNSNNNFANDNNFHVPQLDSFDPVLFGDYRDTQGNMVGGNEFDSAFFVDSFNYSAPTDYASPSNLFGILGNTPSQPANAPTPSRNLMAEIDKTRDGGDDDYGLSNAKPAAPKKTDSSGKLISCNSIWNQLQSNPDFQDGKFDLDNLCSELRSKARCSESGVMVDQDHVDKALKKLSNKTDEKSKPANQADMPTLMFEQESWDNVLRKLGGGAQ